MAAGVFNILIEQGSTFIKNIVIKDSNNNPIDLSGVSSVIGQVRSSYASPIAFPFVLAVVSPATNGEISWTMTAAVTASLNPDPCKPTTSYPWVYDIDLIYSTGIEERILQGNVTISLGVTRE